jgi:hypothetical protein
MDFDPSQVWASLAGGANVGRNTNWNWNLSLDWTDAFSRVIDLRTFASIWYWLAVIVTWSVASNWLIGVPFDMLFRARKYGTQELADLEALVDINVRRIVAFDKSLGPWLTGLVAFFLAVLGMTGFYYNLELAQGLFILAAPLTLVVVINLRLAYQLYQAPLHHSELVRKLFAVRLWTQVIAMVTLFFTAMYGMYYAINQLLIF